MREVLSTDGPKLTDLRGSKNQHFLGEHTWVQGSTFLVTMVTFERGLLMIVRKVAKRPAKNPYPLCGHFSLLKEERRRYYGYI